MLGPDSPRRSAPPLARAKWAKADKRASTCIDDLRFIHKGGRQLDARPDRRARTRELAIK
jgi:hypothetical protein